ncbi:right-handed parallel beta-helix repeat-containing protein [Candidatus Woesearchaeota archaeon]|nr:right-handed parallel beta-helix repeat-containing protein [Candidatus Woesearchaeota archaeon]
MVSRIHPKHKIAFTLAFLVLLTALSLNITILYGKYDSFKDVKDLVGMANGWYNVLPDYSMYDYIPQVSEEQNSLIIDIKPEYVNEFYNLKSSGILTEDDFGGFVYANAMKNEVSFDKMGLSSVPGTFEHFLEYLKSKSLDADTLMTNHLKYLNGDTSIQDTIFSEWHKYSKRYDTKFLNTIDSHQLQLDLEITPKDLGFSSELTAYMNLLNTPKDGTQNPAGGAFKKLLKMLTGDVVFGNCVTLDNLEKTEDGETYYFAGDNPFKGYYFIGDAVDDTITPICKNTYTIEQPIKLADKGKFFCEQGTVIKATSEYTGPAIIMDTGHGENIISGCTFEEFNTAISGNERFNIEIFHNTFKNNEQVLFFTNLQSNEDDEKNSVFPTLKFSGNKVENTNFNVGLLLPNFDGEIILSNNEFINSWLSLFGNNLDETTNPKLTLTKNKFSLTTDSTSPFVVLGNVNKGTIYKNRFENSANLNGAALSISDASNIVVSNNLFTAAQGVSNTKGVYLSNVNDVSFLNNVLNLFYTAVEGKSVNNLIFDKNTLNNNMLVLDLSGSENAVFSNNNLLNTFGNSLSAANNLKVGMKIIGNHNTFYNNKYETTQVTNSNFIYLGNSNNNYLYNVNDNSVYIDGQASSAYMYYPITFDIKRKYVDTTSIEKIEPLEMAQVNIKEKTALNTIVAQALSGIVGVPLNQNIYLYGFTKKANNVKELQKLYTYSVSYGKEVDGANNELALPVEAADLTSQQNIAVEFNDDCISPPVDYNINYKIFEPSSSSYTELIPPLPIKVNPDPQNNGNDYTNILITKDITFCGGLYEIYDGDSNVNGDTSKKGMIQFGGETPITLKCEGTQFKGQTVNENKQGAGIYINQKDDITVEGCTLTNYDNGLLAVGSKNVGIKGNTFKDNNIGLQLNQQDAKTEISAEIKLNTFEDNKDLNILFINPSSTDVSYIYNNNFKNTNPVHHPSVEFDLLENNAATPLDSQLMLYKDGYGNYWEDYKDVVKSLCADNYINYKESYTDADKGNDGFCDSAYKFKANGVDPKYDLLDKYPYLTSIDFSNIIPKTSATVSLTVDKSNNNLVAATTGYESFITSVAYNWFVDEESMTVLNLPMNKWDTEGTNMYRITDISGDNLVAFAGDGTGKNIPELTDEGVGKAMKFSGDEFIKVPYTQNLDNVDEISIEFLFNIAQEDINPYYVLVVRANENKGFLIGYNKKVEDGIKKDNFVFILFKNVDTNGKKVSIPIKTIESTLNPLYSWHHFVGIFDKTTKKLEFYVDNVKITDDTNDDFTGNENLIFNNNDLYFGMFPEKYETDNLISDNGFNGILDEIKIYNKVLSPEQIQANYNALFFEGTLNDQLGPGVLLPNNNIITKETHGDCGNWKVKSWLTTNEGGLISTDALGAEYNSFLCGLEVCTDDSNCNAPKKCLEYPNDQTIKVCDYPSCTNDADCGQGQSCAFGTCLICKGFKNGANSEVKDDMEITEPTLICAGTYNAVDANNDGYIKITKDKVGLMCQDGTKIIGPEAEYDKTISKGSIGIIAENKKNVVIYNCNISKFTTGIAASNIENILFHNNELKENTIGINTSNVKGSFTFSNNVVSENIIGLMMNNLVSLYQYILNSNITNNQYNLFVDNELNSATISLSNLSNSKHLIELATTDDNLKFLNQINNKDIIIKLQSTNVPIFKFYDTYFDDVYFIVNKDLSDADKQTANANIKRYWTLTANVVKSTDGMSPVESASIEITSNADEIKQFGGMVDVNEDNVVDPKDAHFTDKDGLTSFYLFANITDKNQSKTIKDLNPYSITAFKQTGLPGAKPAVSAPFIIKEPTFKKLDLDTGKEFEIPKIFESTVTQSSSTGGGGSSYEKTCSPLVDDKCKLKYKYTPCVLQGNLSYPTKIFTCNSTNNCGMRLFVEPCEGNAPSYAPGCSNKMKDLFEEGVDCGGPCSKQCPATCTDKKQNQGETDVDCGGSSISSTASGGTISSTSGTAGGAGGISANNCAKCLDDKKCAVNEDCKSGFCKNGWCKQATCYDGFKNQDETNVDCGGKTCAPCEGKQEATCYDNIINQGETDVDCGGPCKPCTPVLEQPKGFNYYWLLLLLLIPLIAILFYAGYSQYQKQHKPIPPMSKGLNNGFSKGLKGFSKGNGLPSLDELKLSKELNAEFGKPSKLPNKPMPLKKEIFTEFDNVIKDEIKKLLDEGKSKHEINEALKAKGYPHEKVNYLFENSLHDLLPKTYEQQLKTYINYYLSRGMSKTAIKEALLEKGWNKKIVDGVFGKG